jgi:hypothetical protein
MWNDSGLVTDGSSAITSDELGATLDGNESAKDEFEWTFPVAGR